MGICGFFSSLLFPETIAAVTFCKWLWAQNSLFYGDFMDKCKSHSYALISYYLFTQSLTSMDPEMNLRDTIHPCFAKNSHCLLLRLRFFNWMGDLSHLNHSFPISTGVLQLSAICASSFLRYLFYQKLILCFLFPVSDSTLWQSSESLRTSQSLWLR